jgi:hypothetical protein
MRQIAKHIVGDTLIVEVLSDSVLIDSTDAGLELLMDLYYQNFDGIILYEKNITLDFFDLKSGVAGEILQKFSNYRVQLAIVGDFEKYQSNSIKSFILESNKKGQVNFVKTLSEALSKF